MAGRPRWFPGAAIFVVGAVLFVLAWIFQDSDEGAGEVIGAIGWFGFLLCVLLLILWLVVFLVQKMRGRGTATGER